jgi:glycosyltransferase involved in cell wall biosynthesis
MRKLCIYYYNGGSINAILNDEKPAHVLNGIRDLSNYNIDCIYDDCIPCWRVNCFRRFCLSISNSLRIIRKRRKFDIVFCRTLVGIEFLVFLRSVGLFGKPIVSLSYTSSKNGGNFLLTALYKRMAKGVDLRLVSSLLSYRETGSNGIFNKSNIRYIRCLTSPDFEFSDKIICSNTHESMQPRFISTGRELRDFNTLLKAFEITGKPVTIFSSTVHGDKNYDIFFKNRGVLSPNINLNIDRDNSVTTKFLAEEVYKSLAVVCCTEKPTYNVGLSTISEALGLGVPIIATENAYQDFDIEKEGFGLLVKPYDVDGWCRAIEYIWNNREEAMRMGCRGRKFFEMKWNQRLYVEDLAAILNEMTVNKR